MYQTFKNVVDENFSENFKNYKGKAIVFGGDKDTAVTPKSNQKIASLIQQSKFIMLSGDHYFFLNKNNIKTISKEIKNLIGE